MADPIQEARNDWNKYQNKNFLKQFEDNVNLANLVDTDISQMRRDLQITDIRNAGLKIPVLTDSDSGVKQNNSKLFYVLGIIGLAFWGMKKWLK